MRAPFLIPLAVLLTAPTLGAQCPDGTPPPCGDARATMRAPDANRMLILPFRVSTTDTLLGEGFAELLATEFAHEGLPRAVDMATAMGSWRAAGGRLRAPLTRERAIRLARSLGAGIVSEGSIVGLGKQITINVSLLNSATGEQRTPSVRITGHADSLDVALRRTTSAMMSALSPGRAALAPEGGRYTSSPEAMQAYLEGLALWRQGRANDAALRFDRAIALDSTFAQAVFRRAQAAGWLVPGPQIGFYSDLEWKLRDRLSSAERMVLEAILGPNYPAPRHAWEKTRDLDRAASLLPDSPDALYLAGDEWYHNGAFVVGPLEQWRRAKDYFTRAFAIDSQPLTAGHLVELGVHTFDTALVRSALRAYRAPIGDPTRFGRKWFGAAAIGDTATLSALRLERFVTPPTATTGVAANLPWFADVAAGTLEEFFDRWAAAMPPASVAALRRHYANILAARGRPAAAAKVRESLSEKDRAQVDADFLTLAASGGQLSAPTVAEAARRVMEGRDSVNVYQGCSLLIWKRGKVETAADSAVLRAEPRCAWTLDLLSLPADGSPATLRHLAQADSQLTNVFLGVRPYEPYALARAWEANGQPARALAAIRVRSGGIVNTIAYHPWTLAYEGKLAAQVGDTAGALYADRKWLGMMRDAEPPLAALRDSVRAEVTRLTRKGDRP